MHSGRKVLFHEKKDAKSHFTGLRNKVITVCEVHAKKSRKLLIDGYYGVRKCLLFGDEYLGIYFNAAIVVEAGKGR